MPVVHVRAAPVDAPDPILRSIVAAVATAVGCEPGGVWCTFSELRAQTVGAGEGAIAYVDVWIRARDEPAAATRALEAACRCAAAGLRIPIEDVRGTLRLVEPGRVFAGGALIED